jgi:hypothetical protein
MSARWLIPIALLTACDAFSPVVYELPPPEPPPVIERCQWDLLARCALLDEAPTSFDAADIALPDPTCPDGRVSRTLPIDGDLELDAGELSCATVALEITEPALRDLDDPGVSVTIRGEALRAAQLTIRSAARPARLRLDVARIEDLEVDGDGPIGITIVDADLHRARIDLEAPAAVLAPGIWIEGGTTSDATITLPRGGLRIRASAAERIALDVDALVLEAGSLVHGHVRAGLVDAIGTTISRTVLDVGDLAVGSGVLDHVELVRCGSVLLAGLDVVSSRMASCEHPIVLDDVRVIASAIRGDLRATRTEVGGSALAGASIESDGRITYSALCGVEQVTAGTLHCIGCEPASPRDVCADVQGQETYCPGLCSATCESGELYFAAGTCDDAP